MRREADFIEMKELRERTIDRIDVLDKVGTLLLLPNTEYATTEMVAEYYNVTKEVIRQVKVRNDEELSLDGVRHYKNKEIKELINSGNMSQLKIPPTGTLLFSKRAVLRVGMLLRDSDVANKIKEELGIPVESNLFLRKEIKFKKELDNSLEEIKMELKEHIGALNTTSLYKEICKSIDNLTTYIPQYSVCNNKYRIDFYFPLLNLAIEYDEKYHNTKEQVEKDKRREYEISRDIYIKKWYNDVTEDDLKEWEMKDLNELYDVELEENLLEYSFDETRFIRVREGGEMRGLIKSSIIITKYTSEKIDSRGMSCKYDDIANYDFNKQELTYV